MLDFDRLKMLARGEAPLGAVESGFSAVAPVAATSATGAATGLSHCSYSATGATGQYCRHQENKQNEPVAACSAFVEASEFEIDAAEREAIAIELGGVPAVYASAFARLQAEPPAEVPRDRWHQFINDAGLFLDHWGRQAEAIGWRSEELFGLDPGAPMARYDRMGLIWMLKGERVIELTATTVRLSGGLTYYRKG
jgi:hypothetical protein